MRRILLSLLTGVAACEGPMGPRGYPGTAALDAGPPLLDATLDSGSDSGVLDAGSGDAGFVGLSGYVRDPSGLALQGGQVVLVPAASVADLASAPIDLTLPGEQAALARNDEPLEDVIASNPSLSRAPLATDGSFRFDALPAGDVFVVYVPAPDDALHLPGGQQARTPFAAESLRGATLDLRVSGAPSARASYVGAGSCLDCHGRHSLFASGHALTLRVPGVSAPYQEAQQAPGLDRALSAFAAGTTLYFVGCASASSICAVRTDAPAVASDAVLRARLGVDTTVAADAVGRYFVELSTANSAPARYPVALTLGGSRSLQQYVARVALTDGSFSHFVLPFRYQLAGEESASDPADQLWAAYRIEDWVDLNAGTLRRPDHAHAFERDCAGCHATGFTAQGNDDDGYHGSAVAESDGAYDLDGDGRKELLAVGCEACHGPGSEHLEVSPRGQRIISPRLLTPERQNLVCGICHTRQRGRHGELAPLDDGLRMPRAGIARSTFLSQHVSSIDTSAEVLFRSGDPRVSFEQYGDFLRSPKYRNPDLLVTCTDCHDPHRSAGFASDLQQASPSGNCTSCHDAERDLSVHLAAKLAFAHDVGVDRSQLTCTQCHMVKTGTAGARIPALLDVIDADPSYRQQYYHGDRTSHRFVFTDRSYAAEQPVAATQACGTCHGEYLPVR